MALTAIDRQIGRRFTAGILSGQIDRKPLFSYPEGTSGVLLYPILGKGQLQLRRGTVG